MKLIVVSIASLIAASLLNAITVCPNKITTSDLVQLSKMISLSFVNRNFMLMPHDRDLVQSFLKNVQADWQFALTDAQDLPAVSVTERKRCKYKGVFIAQALDADQMSFDQIKAKRLSPNEIEFTLLNYKNRYNCPDRATIQDIVSSAKGNESIILGKVIIYDNHIWTVVKYGEPKSEKTEGYWLPHPGEMLGDGCSYNVLKDDAHSKYKWGYINLLKGSEVK